MEPIYSQLIIPSEKKYISISQNEGLFLYSFLKKLKIQESLEVGFAYGCSTAFIMSATNAYHYVMDPFQETFYNNIGLTNIKNLGLYDYLKFEQNYSQYVLPKLVSKGTKVDFAFIDGCHKFDNIFVDFFYIDLMLNNNGYIIFHDSWLRTTQFICSWIRTNKKNYSFIKSRIKNFVIIKKEKDDEREYYFFKGFYTIKSLYSHYKKVKELKKRYTES